MRDCANEKPMKTLMTNNGKPAMTKVRTIAKASPGIRIADRPAKPLIIRALTNTECNTARQRREFLVKNVETDDEFDDIFLVL